MRIGIIKSAWFWFLAKSKSFKYCRAIQCVVFLSNLFLHFIFSNTNESIYCQWPFWGVWGKKKRKRMASLKQNKKKTQKRWSKAMRPKYCAYHMKWLYDIAYNVFIVSFDLSAMWTRKSRFLSTHSIQYYKINETVLDCIAILPPKHL